jgi:hypothetical protein
MAENNSPVYSVSHDEAMQLDSTKRCLFPAEDESSLSDLPFMKSRSGGIESPAKTRDGSDQNIARNLPAETRKSPISVVSVFCSGDSTMNFKREKDSDTEEQTVIEVQYIEAGHRDCNVDAVANSHTDNDENSPKRENNTETALNNSKHNPSDFEDVRARPLLDIEKTPSRSQRKKNTTRTPIFGCGRGACLSMCDDSSYQLAERTITDFLEDGSVSTPDAFKTTCHDWQAWSYLGFGRKESPTDAIEQNPSKENIRSVLRRRTSHSLRVRKSNVRQLKQNLAPFAQSPARSPARAPGLFRNRSFSVSDHRSAIVRVSKDKKRVRGSFTDVLQLCTMYESIELDSPDLIRKHSSNKVNDDDLSYDSDPEDFTRRRPNWEAKAAAAVAATTADSSDFEQSENLGHYQSSFSSPSRSLLDVHNEDAFSNIVQEIFNKNTTLVLHPLLDSNKPGSVQLGRPIAVDAWLERGQHLAYALIQPKWIWKAKPRVDAESQSSVRQKFRLQGIELLDITRILKMDETERWSQSFAKPSHCFFIKSIHDEEFCFEAKSRLERDRVVSSLKLLIARFGAKVLTGDPRVYYEFFWINDAVPGKPPNLQEAFVDDLR